MPTNNKCGQSQKNRNESLKDTIEIAFMVQNNTVALMKIISNRVKFSGLPDEDIVITS